MHGTPSSRRKVKLSTQEEQLDNKEAQRIQWEKETTPTRDRARRFTANALQTKRYDSRYSSIETKWSNKQ